MRNNSLYVDEMGALTSRKGIAFPCYQFWIS